MASKGLPKIADVEEESQYGYVFGVSGPGKSTACTTPLKKNCIISDWDFMLATWLLIDPVFIVCNRFKHAHYMFWIRLLRPTQVMLCRVYIGGPGSVLPPPGSWLCLNVGCPSLGLVFAHPWSLPLCICPLLSEILKRPAVKPLNNRHIKMKEWTDYLNNKWSYSSDCACSFSIHLSEVILYRLLSFVGLWMSVVRSREVYTARRFQMYYCYRKSNQEYGIYPEVVHLSVSIIRGFTA